mgnify:CR=1 FL=1
MDEQAENSFPGNTQKTAEDTLPHLPPSNLEVKIRTMASDEEAIKKGGGLLGVVEQASILVSDGDAPAGYETGASKSRALLYFVLVVIGVGALFAIGYFMPKLIK